MSKLKLLDDGSDDEIPGQPDRELLLQLARRLYALIREAKPNHEISRTTQAMQKALGPEQDCRQPAPTRIAQLATKRPSYATYREGDDE